VDSICWEDLKKVKRISENKLTWKQFEKYFRKEYMSGKYYDVKVKEFHDHKLGKLTMDEYLRIFLELLRYVPYIKDEKVRIYDFYSGFP
jgi:hypothetical protein